MKNMFVSLSGVWFVFSPHLYLSVLVSPPLSLLPRLTVPPLITIMSSTYFSGSTPSLRYLNPLPLLFVYSGVFVCVDVVSWSFRLVIWAPAWGCSSFGVCLGHLVVSDFDSNV